MYETRELKEIKNTQYKDINRIIQMKIIKQQENGWGVNETWLASKRKITGSKRKLAGEQSKVVGEQMKFDWMVKEKRLKSKHIEIEKQNQFNLDKAKEFTAGYIRFTPFQIHNENLLMTQMKN